MKAAARERRGQKGALQNVLPGAWLAVGIQKRITKGPGGDTCRDPALCWLIKEDSKFEASLGYTMRPYLKEPKGWPGMWFRW